MTPLRQRMVKDMSVRGLSENTKRSYLNSVTGLARHYPELLKLLAFLAFWARPKSFLEGICSHSRGIRRWQPCSVAV